jgi:hypothetical protein
MWYRFEEGKLVPRIKRYQVAFYDMVIDGMCFDEDFYSPDEINKVMPYIETIEDINNRDRSKVFVHFDNGDIYELKMEKIE